jgi:PAS domain S-box-containing protein
MEFVRRISGCLRKTGSGKRLRASVPVGLLVCLLCLPVASGEPAREGAGRRVLRSGSELGYPPFAIVTDEGRADGFSVRLLRASLERAGLEATFTVAPWSEIRDHLAEGRLDVLPLVGRTPEREAIFDFSIPYMTMHATILTRPGVSGIGSLSDLEGRSVVVMKGDTAQEYLLRHGVEPTATVTSYEEALRELSAGRFDAVVMHNIVAYDLLDRLGIRGVRPTGVLLPDSEQQFCFAVREGEKGLLALLNAGLAVAMRDGTLDRLQREWIALPPMQNAFGGYAYPSAVALVALAVLVLLVVVWQVALQRQVRRTTRELRESEERLQLVLQASRDGIFDLDMQSMQVHYSPRWYTMLGWEPYEMPSTYETWTSLLRPEKRDEVEAFVLERAAKGERFEFEFEMRGKDGVYRWILARGQCVARTADGQPLRIVGSHTDITDRKRAEKALRESRERLRRIFDTLPHGIEELDVEGRVVFCNRASQRLHDRSAEEMIGHLSHEFTGDPARLREVFQHLRREQPEPETLLGTIRRRDGSLLDVEVDWNYIHDESGKLTGYITVVTDVTERRRAEEAVRESELRFRSLFSENQAMMFLLDPESGCVEEANPSACAFFGYDREAMRGMSATRLLNAPPAEVQRQLQASLRSGNATTLLPGRLADGSVREVEAFSSLVPIQGRTYVCAILHDVTEKQSLEQKLAQSEKMRAIGQLAGGIAHDFNNQMTGILGYAGMLADMLEDETQKKYAEAIVRASRTCSDLTSRLLTYSRQGKYRMEPVDLHHSLNGIVLMLTHTLPKTIEIRTDFAAKEARTTGDPSLLENALLNLAINARDAMPGGGTLTLATRSVTLAEGDLAAFAEPPEPGRYILVSVTDTGVGMSDEVRRRIFEPFFSTKERHEGHGVGLGLASVFGTVQSHEGAITVQSETGRGSVFRVYLPLRAQAEDAAAREAAPPPDEGGHVLLVDDEEVVRETICDVLAARGYRVTAVGDGQEAVAWMSRTDDPVDVVLLDMIMPGMDGLETFKSLRAVRPELRVVVASGYSMDARAKEVLDLGGVAFLPKPFDANELTRVLADALRAA